MAALVSANSPFDQYNQGNRQAINADAKRGLAIFQKQCASCHTPPLFTDYSFRNNGTGSQDGDPGRHRITQSSADYGSFEVPSLRNIAITGPYMHDGRYRTLQEVLDHYHFGIKNNEHVDSQIKGGIPLSTQEKIELIAFLNTLTDSSFIENKAFGPPNP